MFLCSFRCTFFFSSIFDFQGDFSQVFPVSSVLNVVPGSTVCERGATFLLPLPFLPILTSFGRKFSLSLLSLVVGEAWHFGHRKPSELLFFIFHATTAFESLTLSWFFTIGRSVLSFLPINNSAGVLSMIVNWC